MRWARPGRFIRDLNITGLLLLVAAGSALLLIPSSDDGLLGLPPFEVGALAPRTIKAQRPFVIADAETTTRLRTEAASRIRPTYDLFLDAGKEAKARIEDAFRSAVEEIGPEVSGDEGVREARSRAFVLALGVSVETDVIAPLVAAIDPEELRDAAVMVAQTVHERRIVADKALLMLQAPEGVRLRWVKGDGSSEHEEDITDLATIIGLDQARAEVDAIVAEQLVHVPVVRRRAVAALVKRLLTPTLVPNEQETARRKEAARDGVRTVVMSIKPGESVVRAGEVLTERHLLILRGIESELRQQSRLQASVGSALLILVLIVLSYRFTIAWTRSFNPSHRDLVFMASVFVSLLLSTWLGYKAVLWLGERFPVFAPSAFRYALPMSAGAMLLRFVLGPRAAAGFIPVAGITAGWMMGASLPYAVFTMAGCLGAASIIDVERPRLSLLSAGIRAGVAQTLVVVSLALLGSSFTTPAVIVETVAAFLSGVVAALFVLLVMPIVEVLFAYTTPIRLADLADLNQPLLRELLVEAPGTYHHSIMVGTLAEAAARAIGADSQLAKVGGYYHDIGKLRNPRAFEENGVEVFANTAPAEEARTIRAHVTDGLELAAKHRLGAPILDIIAQHHGDGVVRRPLRRAPDLRVPAPSDPSILRVSEFSYPGPKPSTVASALVLLADAAETVTRDVSLSAPSEGLDLEAHVRAAVRPALETGQLDQCDLTLKDIDLVVRAFVSILEERVARWGRPSVSQTPVLATPRLVHSRARGEPN